MKILLNGISTRKEAQTNAIIAHYYNLFSNPTPGLKDKLVRFKNQKQVDKKGKNEDTCRKSTQSDSEDINKSDARKSP